MSLLARLLEPRSVYLMPHQAGCEDRSAVSRAPDPADTLVLWWVPPYLLQPTRWLCRQPSETWWWLQPELAWRSDAPPADDDPQLLAPRAAPAAELARLAGAELGHPVDMEPIGMEIVFPPTPEPRTEPAYLVWRRAARQPA